jgi:HK97 gp10 family phage protein
MGIELIVKVDRLPEIIAKLPEAVNQVLSKVALDIVAEAETRSRVRTGAMRAGWQAEQESQLSWRVYNSVGYTIYNEFGTYKMPAAPMLTPAVEHQRGSFASAFRALEGLL